MEKGMGREDDVAFMEGLEDRLLEAYMSVDAAQSLLREFVKPVSAQ